jgi:hypothetical protein
MLIGICIGKRHDDVQLFHVHLQDAAMVKVYAFSFGSS